MVASLLSFFYLLRGIASQTQWTCSEISNDGVHYIPNITWSGWTDANTRTNGTGNSFSATSWVSPVSSSLSCTGSVTAVEFCYRTSENDFIMAPEGGYLVFTISTLRRSGNNFTVIDSIPVHSRPNNMICTASVNYYCCDIVNLDSVDQFQLPQSNFALGITTSKDPAFLQRFLQISQTLYEQPDTLSVGMDYNFGPASLDELHVVRFHLTPVITSSMQPTEAKGSTPVNGMPTNNAATTTSKINETTNVGRNADSTASKVPEIVGAVVAALVVAILSILAILLFTFYYVKRSEKKTKDDGIGIPMTNAICYRKPPEGSTASVIVTYTNKAHLPVRLNTKDESNFAGNISEHMILTEVNQAYEPSVPYNSHKENGPTSVASDTPIRIHTNAAYNCTRIATKNTEDYECVD